LLALVPAAGTPQTIAVQYGSLNGDGTASLTGSGTLTVGLNGAAPVVTPGTGIPAEWVFGTPVPQPDGSWQVALSDVPVTGSLTLYPQKNYEGTPVAQNEHQVATLRTLAYHWAYDSVKVNGERFLSHTVYDPLDVNYDWQRYRDNYRADDIPDISLDYELTSPLIQGVTLGENDVVVQVLVIPQDTDVPVVLSATQVWPEMYATASVTNGLQTHEGVMVVFDRSTPVKVPLQVGTLDEAGHVKWQGSTSVTAGWDETAQRPVLVLDPDTTPEDWQLWPLNATDQPGLWRTELSVSMTVKMQYSSNAPAGMFGNIYPTNKITFYGSPMQTVSASLDSPTAYFISNEMTTASVTLDSSGYGLLEVYNSQPETITVTASSAVLPQTIDMTFTKVDSALWTFCNINTPADGKTPGTVYYIDRQTGSEALNMSLSGSATFSDGQSTGSFSVSSTYAAVNIYDNIAETVTVTMYTANHDVPDDQINFVSVIANDSNK
uniref:hypothetical protein n=1 Tax=Kluyvera intermedia TaxID=61648 RepID=UPI00372CEB49